MFRQILIEPTDADFQRILWRPKPESPLQHYRLRTVTYGLDPVPYLAMRVLQQLAIDDGHRFPATVPIIENSIYVDDTLFGSTATRTTGETENFMTLILCASLNVVIVPGLTKNLVDADKTANITRRHILDSFNITTHHQNCTLNSLFIQILFFPRLEIGSHDSSPHTRAQSTGCQRKLDRKHRSVRLCWDPL